MDNTYCKVLILVNHASKTLVRGDTGNAFKRCRQAVKRCLFLWMLPAFIDDFDAVAIGIEETGGIVARVVIQARARCAVVDSAGGNRCSIRRIDLGAAAGHEADMRRARIGAALPQPEKDAAIGAEIGRAHV